MDKKTKEMTDEITQIYMRAFFGALEAAIKEGHEQDAVTIASQSAMYITFDAWTLKQMEEGKSAEEAKELLPKLAS